jgi:hypothetical protein
MNASYYNLHLNEIGVSGLYLFRWLLYSSVYFSVIDLVRSREDVKVLLTDVAISMFIFAAFGIFQAVFLPSFAFVVHPEAQAGFDFDIQYDRLVSTFLDPNLAGCLIAVALVSSVAFVMAGYRIAWLGALVFGPALILTYSRGALLSFLVGLLYLVFTGKHKRRALAATVTLALALLLLTPYFLPRAEAYGRLTISDPSASARVTNWIYCTELIRDNFFFGIGFNTLGYIGPHYRIFSIGGSAFGLDGGLLFMFALTGFLGFSVYAYLLGKVIWVSHRVCAHTTDHLLWALAKGCIASTIVIVTSSFFTSSMFYPFIMEAAWLQIGLVTVANSVVDLRKAKAPKLTDSRQFGASHTKLVGPGQLVPMRRT